MNSKTKTQGRAKALAQAVQPESKLNHLAALLNSRHGATIEEMMAATGWQAHSVRGALAGSLKRRGLLIDSEKVDGVRRYRIEQ